jgi:SAM-dependent methyltransferase
MAFERIVPDTPEWTAYYANHIQRYMFAADRLREAGSRHVLDVACGVGYGSAHLNDAVGVSVVAVDRDPGALDVARARFARAGVTPVRDDCHTLASVDAFGPFDAVVTFETIEHLPKPEQFLAHCRQLLTPAGFLVASTPNVAVRGPAGSAEWDFHEREYTASELVSMLAAAGFRGVTLYGQRVTAIGRLRGEVRGELNLLRFNPFNRLGLWVQRVVRGRPRPLPALPERLDDFEIAALESASKCDAMGEGGPFVLIAVARP